jgi:hypothetical protein
LTMARLFPLRVHKTRNESIGYGLPAPRNQRCKSAGGGG